MYCYRQLDRDRKEIRLLLLEPGCETDIVRCALEHTFLDRFPARPYETISYVCGDPNVKNTIILHDVEVEVPANSEAVLRRMRLPTTKRVLWIDAICIAQDNIDERSHQVGMMYLVYTNTVRNLIWLGEDDGHTAKALESMRIILAEIDAETQGSTDLGGLLFDETGNHRYSRKDLPIALEDSSLPQFFGSSWFSRLWVVQEASLAPSSVCHRGSLEVSLHRVLRVAIWVRYKRLTVPHNSFNINQAAAIFEFADKTYGTYARFPILQGMTNVLGQATNFYARDPRDHAFAILGLWQSYKRPAELPDILQPDYTLDIHTVFRNTMRFAIREWQNLSTLTWDRGPREGQECEQWPSWVQRLDHKDNGHDRHAPVPLMGQRFCADDRIPMQMLEDSSKPNVLTVRGLIVDKVAVVIPGLKAGQQTSTLQDSFVKMEDLQCSCWVVDPVGGIETKVALVLTAGLDTRRAPVNSLEALHSYQNFKKYLSLYENFPLLESFLGSRATNLDKVVGRFQDAMEMAVFNRVVFRTQHGHIGIGPLTTQIGDTVSILYGCNLPVVLKANDEGTAFTLKGASYVHGVMNGEAVQRHKARGMDDVMFDIV